MDQSLTQTQRIVVALDTSPQSYAALETAARLARLMGAELYGLFVEDSLLHQLGDFPFSAEVGAYSATPRALTQLCIGRQFRAVENAAQQRMRRVAAQAHVAWRFEVIQGGVASELMNAAANAAILSLGRAGWSKGKRLGSTAAQILAQVDRPILLSGKKSRWSNRITALFTGSPASARALQQAAQLARQSKGKLTVETPSQELASAAAQQLANLGVEAHLVVRVSNVDWSHELWQIKDGLLVMPKEMVSPLAALLDILDLPILLVP
ncbi:MAG: universal stress protein [Caldilineaceae bacterium]